MRRFALSAALFLVVFALRATSVSAVPLYAGLSPPSGAVVGEVTFLGLVPGLPNGAVATAPSGDPVPDPLPGYVASALFRVTMTGTLTLAQIGLMDFLNDDIAYGVGGWIPGATEPDGLVDGVPLADVFYGASFPTGVAPGQTSNTVLFMIDTREPRRLVQVTGTVASGGFVTSGWMAIPEPGSATALAFGLGLLGALRARRRAAADVALAA